MDFIYLFNFILQLTNQVFNDIEKKHLSYIDYTLYNLKKESLTEKLKNNCEKI